MKRRISRMGIFLVAVLIILSGCSVPKKSAGSGEKAASAERKEPGEQVMSITDFENLLASQPLTVVKTKYVVQDKEHKALYPDMLKAVIQNNTTEDIKDAVVAFVAWDKNNLPVKIEAQFDFTDGYYVQKVDYDDINLVAGDTYGEDSGFSIDEDCKIKTFKAIAVSFETFDGETWENPYYDSFCTLYKGQKYSDDMTVKVKIVESKFAVSKSADTTAAVQSHDPDMSEKELKSKLAKQPVTVIKTKYVVQDKKYKSLYPDMLQAIIKNNTKDDIKNAVVAFVAWDKNKLPVMIEGQFDFGDGSYVQEVSYDDINLAAGDTYGKGSGFSIDEDCKIKTFKAIVVSYETFDGDTWENPYYENFCSLYEGQKLK